MSKNVVGQDNVQPSKFSKCSVDDYHESLQQIEEASCLLRTPSKVNGCSFHIFLGLLLIQYRTTLTQSHFINISHQHLFSEDR